MRRSVAWALGGLAVTGWVNAAHAAVVYSVPTSTYSQHFDTLPNTPENVSLGTSPTGWTDDNAAPGAGNFSIVGWYLYHPTSQSEGGFNNHQRMRITSGTSNTGAFYSFGASGSTERALGSIGSSTITSGGAPCVYGARFTNSTGVTLDSFTLDFTAEEWRDGGQTTTGSLAQSVTFGWKVGAANIQDTGFNAVAGLGFTSPTFGATAGTALDGNLAANRVAVGPVTVTGINWAPGTDLWIRWEDVDHSSNDHGLGIDDVSFSADVPEPATLSALAVCALMLAGRRRRVR